MKCRDGLPSGFWEDTFAEFDHHAPDAPAP